MRESSSAMVHVCDCCTQDNLHCKLSKQFSLQELPIVAVQISVHIQHN